MALVKKYKRSNVDLTPNLIRFEKATSYLYFLFGSGSAGLGVSKDKSVTIDRRSIFMQTLGNNVRGKYDISISEAFHR